MQLSEKSLAICKTYWKEDSRGRPKPDCCHGCPVKEACHSGTGGTEETHNAWRGRCNAAAEQVTM